MKSKKQSQNLFSETKAQLWDSIIPFNENGFQRSAIPQGGFALSRRCSINKGVVMNLRLTPKNENPVAVGHCPTATEGIYEGEPYRGR
jgi:hypothetical protein